MEQELIGSAPAPVKEKILDYYDAGTTGYKEAWDMQKKYNRLRIEKEIPDTLFLLEHPNTYTFGKNADKRNLVSSEGFLEKNGISVFEIDRGGDITYHGPGQAVGYPIIDLNDRDRDSHNYLRSLEEIIINVCTSYGLKAGRNPKYTGVWIEDRKICAMGIKLSRWVTMHGFAFNVNTNLELFKGIVPCGITGKSVTSLKEELGMEKDVKIDMQDVKENILRCFRNEFGYRKIERKSF